MVFIPPYDPQQHRSVHDQAASRLRSWYNDRMKQEQEATKNAVEPDISSANQVGEL